MLKERDAIIRRFMRIVDICVILVGFVIAYQLRGRFHAFYKFDIFPSLYVVSKAIYPFEKYVVFIVIVIPIWITVLNLLGVYQSFRTRSAADITWSVIKSTAYTTIIFGALSFLLKIQYISRLLFFLFMSFSTFMLILEKYAVLLIVRYMRRKGYNFRRLLIVGSGLRAQNFMRIIEHHPEWGFRITGIIEDDKKKIGQKVMNYEIIGTLGEMQDILHRRTVDEVVFIVPRSWLDRLQDVIAICEVEGVRTTLAVDLFGLKIAHAKQVELEGIPFLTFETTIGHEGQLFIKRFFDVIFSATAIVLLSPVFLIIGILIKLSSKGPVIFAQKRVGRHGKRFILYKFRSMYYGAHKRLAELEKFNEARGPVFKIKDDPRITPVGGFLRKFSIDELPQLFNVLMGHMSIVSPRPPLPREVQKYEPWQRRRLSMRPGMTCLWQISGRSNVDFEEWMKLDLEYIDNWSLWLDFKIALKTIPVVIFGIGAR